MRRKVNKVGQNTLTVSLPSKWTRTYSVKQGDEIEVEERANSLIISRSRQPHHNEISFEIKSPERYLARFPVTPYIKGYDIITIKYGHPEVFKLVQDTVSRLLVGFEIVDHSRNQCTIKNIAEGVYEDFETNQKRYIFQVKTLLHETIDSLRAKDFTGLQNALLLDKTIDKICLLIRRILNTRGYKDESRGKSVYYVTILLETIADRIRDMCKEIIKTNKFPSKKYIDLFEKLIKSLDIYFELFHKYDREKIVDYSNMTDEIKKECIEYMQKNPQEAYLCHQLLSIAELEHNLTEELE